MQPRSCSQWLALGYRGHMFLAEFGWGTPLTGDPNANGLTVIRIDPATKETRHFLSNRASAGETKEMLATPAPGTRWKPGFRPMVRHCTWWISVRSHLRRPVQEPSRFLPPAQGLSGTSPGRDRMQRRNPPTYRQCPQR